MASELRALVGPTASGKEFVAVHLARDRPLELLSLDSMKVFRGMNIATAKASPEARRQVPHHLLDLVDPGEPFSTRRWIEAASVAETEVRSRDRLPLFVGGTPLYLKALLFGIFEGPAAHPDIRRRLRSLPLEELSCRLAEVDPISAAKIHENDVRRLIRALEIFEVTGRPASALRREWDRLHPLRPARLAGIRRDRQDLYARIDARVDRMIDEGLVEEVEALLDRPGGIGPTARQALGVKEIADHLEGRIARISDAIDLLKRRTRLFARRQITWFKHFAIEWIPAGPDDSLDSIAAQAAHILVL